MRGLFGNPTDVLAETARVAELCEFDFEKRYFLPQYPRPAEFASTRICWCIWRAGAPPSATAIRSRMRSSSASCTSSTSSRTPDTPAIS